MADDYVADVDASVDRRRRVLLLTLCEGYHGSTALAQLLLSSANVASLCGAHTWQCEGGLYAVHRPWVMITLP